MNNAITIYNGVLNDDTLSVATDGTALLEYHTYATEWSNNLHKKRFQCKSKAIDWYKKHMTNRVFEQGKRWLEEDGVNYSDTPEDYWSSVVYCDLV